VRGVNRTDVKRAAGVLELMDGHVAAAELEGSLVDLERANRFLGGSAPILREIRRVDGRRVLDIGSGSADIPLAIVRDGARHGRDVRVTCLDRSESMIAIARRRTGNDERLTFVRGEGDRLPFDSGTFDVTTCALALHHFEPTSARLLLAEMRRVAGRTPIVCDLRRSRVAHAGVLLWSTVCTRNRLTRHDGPLSVRRAYTPDEACELAHDAGWSNPRVRKDAFFRMTLTDG